MPIEHFPVEAGHVLMFARAIGDAKPVYASLEGGPPREPVPAPPTFVTAGAQFDPAYPLRPKAGEPWFGSGREATGRTRSSSDSTKDDGGKKRGGGGGALHAEQHYEYHRPLVIGDVLHARIRRGNSWDKEGRSGTLKFSELITEYFDEADELVVTGRAVLVVTEKKSE